MNVASVNKDPMTMPDEIEKRIQNTVKAAKEAKHMMDYWIGEYEEHVNRLVRYDAQNGTNYAAPLITRSLDSGARTTQTLLEIVEANNGKLDKEALITAGRAQGIGRGATEGKMRGSIGAQIEKLLRPESKKLRRDERGRIWLGTAFKS